MIPNKIKLALCLLLFGAVLCLTQAESTTRMPSSGTILNHLPKNDRPTISSETSKAPEKIPLPEEPVNLDLDSSHPLELIKVKSLKLPKEDTFKVEISSHATSDDTIDPILDEKMQEYGDDINQTEGSSLRLS